MRTKIQAYENTRNCGRDWPAITDAHESKDMQYSLDGRFYSVVVSHDVSVVMRGCSATRARWRASAVFGASILLFSGAMTSFSQAPISPMRQPVTTNATDQNKQLADQITALRADIGRLQAAVQQTGPGKKVSPKSGMKMSPAPNKGMGMMDDKSKMGMPGKGAMASGSAAMGMKDDHVAGPASGQTADEHAKHHPAPGGASPAPNSPAAPAGMPMPGGGNPAPAAAGNMGGNQPDTAPGSMNAAPAPGAMGGNQPAGAGGGGMGAGMGEMMGEMMKQMGVPPRKELYPSLMALPDEVTPEQRAEIERLAQERIKAGTARLSSGLEKLSDSTSGEDYAAMQQATAQMREGLAEFEVGIGARRILSEGKAPRNLALDWFKREMNLASPVRLEKSRALLGVTPFHLFTMVLLIAFALAMVAMYFFKMRRAAALFGRLDSDSKSPPPGAAPPLAGGPGPSAPVAPPAGGTPPPSAAPPPSSPAAPPAEKSPAPDPPPGGAPPPAAPTSPATPAAGTPAASAKPLGGSSAVPVPGGDAGNAADKPPAPPPAGASPASPATPPAAPGGDAAEIAGRADELWQARGRPMGSPEIDWLRAEGELAKAADKPPAPPPSGNSPASPATPPAVSEATS